MTTHATQPDFYADLTRRNRGFVSDRAQSELSRARLLIAGCGSTGGAAVEPLVRLGAQNFVLADNGSFELNNLNRQHAVVTDIGSNKADVAAARVTAINPYAQVEVVPEGITEDNVARLVSGCSSSSTVSMSPSAPGGGRSTCCTPPRSGNACRY